jgi:hypothetical protein
MGMGQWALGSQCVARVPRVEASGVMGHWAMGIGNNSFPFPFTLSPFPLLQCLIHHSLFLIDFCSGFGNTLSFSINTAFPG